MADATRKVCVIGGGYTGLAAAIVMARKGHVVVLCESSDKVGGLAAGFPLAGTRLDANYRHLFRTDSEARHWIAEYGLPLEWRDSRMGFFTHGRLYPFGKPHDLLRFDALPFWDRIRFGVGTLRIKHQRDIRPLESETAVDYLTRLCGSRAFETIWKPLLVAKFGDEYPRIGAAWMWGKIALRARSRDASGLQEKLGYMPGSFACLTDKMAEELTRLGVVVRLRSSVRSIDRATQTPQGVPPVPLAVIWEERNPGSSSTVHTEAFDAVISCIPLPEFAAVGNALSAQERSAWKALRYTAVTCLILQLKAQFSPFYWLNIGDRSIPFGGLIEQTNLVPSAWYGGSHILYISHYMYEDHPYFGLSRDALVARYLPHLKTVNPRFQESDIQGVFGGQGRYTQPLIGTHYAAMKPTYSTSHPALFHASMAHIYPEDRGMNYALKTGREVAEACDAWMRT